MNDGSPALSSLHRSRWYGWHVVESGITKPHHKKRPGLIEATASEGIAPTSRPSSPDQTLRSHGISRLQMENESLRELQGYQNRLLED